ncbi:hydantoinase B/oxoprolinase family protein [Parahaliea mediterranea]|uniref:Hydantoinase B/oxoprolinase family protein n=1 Tax=Parahaliea mediterranea TaxID=651086 RepID=A0A939ILM0_9GAMM|nr:hydantoinase B/oxoprolinase family protein [Parahaliea mediterranea]MBN7796635.1 hydantoinase B/oxoprolinase family protein [Parahaliea mediterranea]
MTADIFTAEIIKDAIVSLGEEMFIAMVRTSMSPIIYETTDFAVGATDAEGNLLAQGNGVTAFLATLDTAVQSLLTHYGKEDIRPGDVFISNTPYEGGGTHLSDVVLMIPVFSEGDLIAWTVNKAHWTEVGGAQPGSVSTVATEIYQEGLHFRFLKLYDEGRENTALTSLIRTNVRLPDSTIGDMHAGVAAAKVGARRIEELVGKYGRGAVLDAMRGLLDYGERMTQVELGKLPQGTFEAEDIVEEDGLGNGPFTVKVKITIDGHRMVADFTGTDPQVAGPINCSYTGLVTGARCLFKSVTNTEIPANGGCFRALEVICPEGTILSAQNPAPVSLYYEPLIAAIDVMWKALAPSLPDRLPAGHQRSVGATFISGVHPDSGDLFVMGEPLVGGWGASDRQDGDNGQFCCANGETFNIPVELFESRYGLQVQQYAFHDEDGGAGEFRGGKGVILDYQVTAREAFLTYAASRTQSRPWGMRGGQAGSNNYAQILKTDGSVERHHMCTMARAGQGDVIRLVSATGGGYGRPEERPREALESDIKNGYVTPAQAKEYYGYQA